MKPLIPKPPPGDHSRATKRKRRLTLEHSARNHSYTKRRKITFSEETETLTRGPGPSRNPPTSNRFELVHSSRKRHQSRKRRDSSTTDGHRRWTLSSRDFSNFKDKFVFVSYNILGVENALKHPDLYNRVPPEFLEWDRRKMLICEEISRYNASILYDLLQKDGFRAVYKARTGDAYDGCAIFWRDNMSGIPLLGVRKLRQSPKDSPQTKAPYFPSQKLLIEVLNMWTFFSFHKWFTLLHQENIEFRNFGLRHNVAQLCVLKVRLFLEKAYKLSEEYGGIPVLLAGDFNSSPQSAIYQFLASSELDIRNHDRRYISGQVELPSNCGNFRFQNRNATKYVALFNLLVYVGCSGWMSNSRQRWSDEELRHATGSHEVTKLQHQLKLCSAYFGIPGSCRTRDSYGEPLATSYHTKFMGTVDYIWHTEELLPVRVLETLPVNTLRRTAGLPCEFKSLLASIRSEKLWFFERSNLQWNSFFDKLSLA
ncbi:hypothetical protein JRO89_XS13G0014700 [Xanthoceras sorbifolium]|uniref:Endonuclease/exonuclease/phosphatase domain-containing protein n=1 Tax=Xanthoceras sorbifolium TaxID=99658 RepID=A0ABQ8H611_9ROSI|nr:hypothetical protein JRO89_XS13G0014700 [Xanthoceras sorbifolium]